MQLQATKVPEVPAGVALLTDSRGVVMAARRFCALSLLLAFVGACVFATGARADVFTSELPPSGTTQALSPSISSDRSIHGPGDHVVLSGSN